MRILARVLYIPTVLRLLVKQRLKLNSWYNRIDGTVLLGALPFRSMTRELVEREKVKSVLSYNQDYELKLFTNSKEEWSKNGVQQYVYNTWDFQPPSIEDINSGIAVIERERRLKRSVYVHCKAGKGRSATVVTCYVIKRYKMVPNDAIDFVERKRPQVRMNKYQRQAIVEFYKNLLEKGD